MVLPAPQAHSLAREVNSAHNYSLRTGVGCTSLALDSGFQPLLLWLMLNRHTSTTSEVVLKEFIVPSGTMLASNMGCTSYEAFVFLFQQYELVSF